MEKTGEGLRSDDSSIPAKSFIEVRGLLWTRAMHVVHESRPAPLRDRLLRLPEVQRLSGLGKSSIYALMKSGEFPKAVRLHSRLVCWSEAAVLTWVQSRIAEAQQ